MTTPILADLYRQNSKHSNYQVLARPLRALLAQDQLRISSRYEVERFEYLLAHHPVRGLQVADIGGNTGFFTLECAAAGAASVLYIEGNAAHAQFVALASTALGMDHVVRCHNAYLDLRDGDAAGLPGRLDCCLLLNVLHHLGDDYGDPALSRESAKQGMLASLAYLARKTDLLVFQLGFNWKGDRTQPLFEHGSKAELIDFVRQGTAHDWDLLDIGIAERDAASGQITYQPLNDRNIARDDSLGEFLNRPLFVLRSKHTAG